MPDGGGNEVLRHVYAEVSLLQPHRQDAGKTTMVIADLAVEHNYRLQREAERNDWFCSPVP